MQIQKNESKYNYLGIILFTIYVAFTINHILGFVTIIIGLVFFIVKKPTNLISQFSDLFKNSRAVPNNIIGTKSIVSLKDIKKLLIQNDHLVSNKNNGLPAQLKYQAGKKIRLNRKNRYLQIALNNTTDDAQQIISQLPVSDRVLIEVGTPLIKEYGTKAISKIIQTSPYESYIVADNKCADLGSREVEIMAKAGANASTCLGVAPIETIDDFIAECEKYGIDSMIDMMNVENPLLILKQLKKIPAVVMLHRGVDETEFSKEKQIPYYQIKQIKGTYNILVAVAGGDTVKEIQRAFFNDADIVVVWKNFYQANSETAQLAKSFLREIK